MSAACPIEIASSPESDADFLIVGHVGPSASMTLPSPDSDSYVRILDNQDQDQDHGAPDVNKHIVADTKPVVILQKPFLTPESPQRAAEVEVVPKSEPGVVNVQVQLDPGAQGDEEVDELDDDSHEEFHAYPAPSIAPSLCPLSSSTSTLASGTPRGTKRPRDSEIEVKPSLPLPSPPRPTLSPQAASLLSQLGHDPLARLPPINTPPPSGLLTHAPVPPRAPPTPASQPAPTQPTQDSLHESTPVKKAKKGKGKKGGWKKQQGPHPDMPTIPEGLTVRPPEPAEDGAGVEVSAAPAQDEPVCVDTVEVRNTGTRGRGLYALQAFSPGDIIFTEEPLMTARLIDPQEELITKIMGLSYLQQKALWQLEGSGDYQSLVRGMIKANGIPCPETEDDDDEETEYDDERMGIFQTIGRINHSCAPNAGWFWSQLEQRLLLVAFHHIKPGEELLASYIGDDKLLANRKKRRQLIKLDTGFKCACALCTLPKDDTQSEQNRERIAALFKTWADADVVQLASERDILQRLHEAAQLTWKERLVGPLVEIFINAFYVLAAWGQLNLARQAAGIALDALTCLRGRKEAERHFIFENWRNPRKWPSYGFMVSD